MQEILRGKTKIAQKNLEELFKRVGGKPKMLWYPSAGNDFRDIMEFSPLRMALHGIKEAPDIYIHTDYNYFEDLTLNGIIYNDGSTKVTVVSKFKLVVKNLNNDKDERILVCTNLKKGYNPSVFLLNVHVESNKYGLSKGDVIYFTYENNHFLDSVLLRNKIKISHFLKVREGLGFGGSNGMSINYVLALFSNLGVQYMLIDNQIRIDWRLLDTVARHHRLTLFDYNLEQLGPILEWSGFLVRTFRITYSDTVVCPLSIHCLKECTP